VVIFVAAYLHRQIWSAGLLGGLACIMASELQFIQAPASIEITPYGIVFSDHFIDLTGRIPVWEFSWWLFRQEPLWGSGFDAIWTYAGGSSLYDALGWRLTDSHNGYLDLLVQTGLIGALLYGAVLCLTTTTALRLMLSGHPKSLEQAMIALFALLQWLINLTSSQTTECLSLWNFLFLVMCFASARHRRGVSLGIARHAKIQHRDTVPRPPRIVVARHPVHRAPELARL